MKQLFKFSAAAVCISLALTACKQEVSGTPAAASAPNRAAADLGSDAQQISYAMGLEIGRTLKQIQDNGTEVDLKLFNEAVDTLLDGKTPKLDEQQAQEVIVNFLNAEQAKMAEKAAKAAEDNLAKGKAFLAENAKKEGVKTTASGLQYKVNKEGTGASPNASDTVQAVYAGRLIDGTEFDNSKGQAVTFPLNGVIKGWTEGLQLMKEGAEYTFYIPADLAYGERDAGRIPPQSVLVFDVKLVKVEKAK